MFQSRTKNSAHSTPASDPIAACHGVSLVYTRGHRKRLAVGSAPQQRPSVTALSDVSVEVNRGEIVGLAGPSGSGKSSLLHLLGALETPTRGDVFIAHENVGELSSRERTALRLETIGIVFQRFYLLAALSARANVALPLIEFGVGKRARRQRATDLLDQVGLGDRATHRPGELSGGEQQRVAIARALATNPSLLIADEPTGELDSETGRQVLDVFEGIATDRGIVIASHDDETLAIADRVIRLQDGHIVTDG